MISRDVLQELCVHDSSYKYFMQRPRTLDVLEEKDCPENMLSHIKSYVNFSMSVIGILASCFIEDILVRFASNWWRDETSSCIWTC